MFADFTDLIALLKAQGQISRGRRVCRVSSCAAPLYEGPRHPHPHPSRARERQGRVSWAIRVWSTAAYACRPRYNRCRSTPCTDRQRLRGHWHVVHDGRAALRHRHPAGNPGRDLRCGVEKSFDPSGRRYDRLDCSFHVARRPDRHQACRWPRQDLADVEALRNAAAAQTTANPEPKASKPKTKRKKKLPRKSPE